MRSGPRPPPGDIILLSFEQVDRIARDTAGTYFSLDHKCVAPAPLAACDCSESRRLRPCGSPDALGVHLKPVPPMNCGGDGLLEAAVTSGYDIARACALVHVNCRAGEHRTGSASVAAHWFLSFSTPQAVLHRILMQNPARAALLRDSPIPSPRLCAAGARQDKCPRGGAVTP